MLSKEAGGSSYPLPHSPSGKTVASGCPSTSCCHADWRFSTRLLISLESNRDKLYTDTTCCMDSDRWAVVVGQWGALG